MDNRFNDMSFDEMRTEMFKMMDKTCKENNISRDELVNQISKYSRRQEKKAGGIKVTKIK